jgi:hypothetical protein
MDLKETDARISRDSMISVSKAGCDRLVENWLSWLEPVFDGAREIPYETVNSLAVRPPLFFLDQTSRNIFDVERDVWPREQLLHEER